MKNRKKICFLCDTVLSIGGVQRVLAVIAIELCKYYDVTIISLHDNDSSDKSLYGLDHNNVHIEFFHPSEPGSLIKYAHKAISGLYKRYLPHTRITSELYARSSFPSYKRKQYISKLNGGEYDVIVGVHAGLSIKLATIRKHLKAKKIIGWMHNSYEALFVNTPAYLPGLANHFMHQMKKLDDFIVLCNTDAQKYREKMHLSPTVIYNPLTLKPGSPSKNDSKQFLSIGRMTPLHKGFDILIKAFALFAEKNKEWTLCIVGEGPEEHKLRAFIAEKHLEDRITIHPFTNNIQEYYTNASVYVLASRWEGMPLVLVEAMSHHLPIISSDIPVAKEILNSDVAYYFKSTQIKELSERMIQIANIDSNALYNYANEAIIRATSFAKNDIIAQWVKELSTYISK